jgi:cytochrome c peroxidase
VTFICRILLPVTVILLSLTLRAGAQSLQLTPNELTRNELSSREQASILSHGPWPLSLAHDESNRGANNHWAIAMGAALFFDARASLDESMSCASCHLPDRWFTDGRAITRGRETLTRNTPSVVDSHWQRWLGWGGANDNIWAQTLRALKAPREMASTDAHLAQLIRSDEQYLCALKKGFSPSSTDGSDEAVAVLTAKALAAFQGSLISSASSFDEFVAALRTGDGPGMAAYPPSAFRGLKIFIGEGRCNLCHLGPRFTNDEFAEIGIGYFVPDGVDKGRYGGITQLKASRYNRLGPFSDSNKSPRARFTLLVERQARNFGEFKVPSLRNVARTAPYMHDGSLATLEEVVDHYSELNIERLHVTTGSLLRPLRLSPPAKRDLVSFLRSLNSIDDNFDAPRERLDRCSV